ncbi:contact-dependent growth inhibition system immunity protein [Flagellimonas flava]|uniref:contact-dependent growth inhibition system immunity protein n=1 Tax=Flagellimonas flava TaxID=570519 RepID=UPI003D65148C
MTYSKSLEQLENDYWEEPGDFPSGLVQNCYKYRKIPLNELTIEQLRLLIGQNIGLTYSVPLAMEKLKTNVLEEGDFYEGDLLVAVSKVQVEFWKENQTEFETFKKVIETNSEIIANELGPKDLDLIIERLKAV